MDQKKYGPHPEKIRGWCNPIFSRISDSKKISGWPDKLNIMVQIDWLTEPYFFQGTYIHKTPDFLFWLNPTVNPVNFHIGCYPIFFRVSNIPMFSKLKCFVQIAWIGQIPSPHTHSVIVGLETATRNLSPKFVFTSLLTFRKKLVAKKPVLAFSIS